MNSTPRDGGVPPMKSTFAFTGTPPAAGVQPRAAGGPGGDFARPPVQQMQGLTVHPAAAHSPIPARPPGPYGGPPLGMYPASNMGPAGHAPMGQPLAFGGAPLMAGPHSGGPPRGPPNGLPQPPAAPNGLGPRGHPLPAPQPGVGPPAGAFAPRPGMPPPPGAMPPPPGAMPPPPGAMPPLPTTMPPPPGGPLSGPRPLGPPRAGAVPPPPFGAARPPFGAPASAPNNPFARPSGMPLPPPGAPGFPAPTPPPPGASSAFPPPAAAPMPTRQAIQNRIDPSSIPRPSPHPTDLQVFQTRNGPDHAIPPPATSNFIVRDMGTCSPRFMRASLNTVPVTNDLLNQAAIPFSLVISPMGLSDPADDPIPIVDMGESGPIRCSRCKAYINPYVRWTNSGKQFACNFCNHTNPTPDNYFCYLGPDGRRRDTYERPELCKGTVEFVATAEYQIRPPMPVVHFFLVDVGEAALAAGVSSAACSAIRQVLGVLQGGDDTLVGIATFDNSVQFYSMTAGCSSHMLVMSDVAEPFAPQSRPLLCRLGDCREVLEALLEALPTTFASSKAGGGSCGAAALEAAVDALKPTGGKLHAFLSQLPSVGAHPLKFRTAAATSVEKMDKEKQTLLQPQDNSLATLAALAAEHQICIDLLLLTTGYVDAATLGQLCHTTSGTLYHYHPFDARLDHEQLLNDLRWNVTRPQALEAVMKVRCSTGLDVESYLGAFYKPNVSDLLLAACDCDKAIVARLHHLEKLPNGQDVHIQCALLYTTTSGARRVRVHNLALPTSNAISAVFKGADLDAYITHAARRLAASMPGSTLAAGRELVTNGVVAVLHGYRKYCATSSSAVQLILPEALKLLPLYSLALLKGPALRADIQPDDRTVFLQHMLSLPSQRVVPMLYPRLLAVHHLADDCPNGEVAVIPKPLALSAEGLENGGIYLLENGFEALLYLDPTAKPELLHDLLAVSSGEELALVPVQGGLVARDGPFSRAVRALLELVRLQRCGFMRLRLVRKGDPLEATFFSMLVEDRYNVGIGSSYVEYLCHIHRLIQNKMG